MAGSVMLHAGYDGAAPTTLFVVLAVASLGTALLLALALVALYRRRSRPYLLIAAAVATILARSAVAAVTAARALSPTTHHLLEHGLDAVLVGLVIAAVYVARESPREVESG
jgi:hypothetical protein